MKRHSLVLVAVLLLAASSGGAAQQSAQGDEVTPPISRLEQWLSAIVSHRPGAMDEQVRLVNTWNQEQLELLGNGPEARQSYERAAKLAPMAQSPLFGLSRLAEQAGIGWPPATRWRAYWRCHPMSLNARILGGLRGRAGPRVDAMLADLRQRVAKLPE